MNKNSRRPLLAACAVISILASSSSLNVPPPNMITVDGFVTETDQKTPILGVVVRADRGGHPVNQTKTLSDGSYKLPVVEGMAFDLLYDHSSWHPDTLKRLSGQKNHSVNKVLYRPGQEEQAPVEAIFNIFVSYEHIYFLAVMRNTPVLDLRQQYGERLRAMKLPKIDGTIGQLLQGKQRQVFALYEEKQAASPQK